MRKNNIPLVIWYCIIGLFILMCMMLGHAQNFPVANIWDCYNGVDILDDYYQNNSVMYAYNRYPSPGHCWLIVDGVPIDSYYGVMNIYQYRNPQYLFNSYDEFKKGVHDITAINVT